MIEYFTDGSAEPNPGYGGYAVIKNGEPFIMGGEPSNSPFKSDNTTNIRMEGWAIMAALDDADGSPCSITTDSQFWINVLTKWAPTWENNNWSKKGGIKNLDIVMPLYKKYVASNAKLIWTRGHVGTELNELADQYANEARRLQLSDPVIITEL